MRPFILLGMLFLIMSCQSPIEGYYDGYKSNHARGLSGIDPSIPIDVFAVAGQSNGYGVGDVSQAVFPPGDYSFTWNGYTKDWHGLQDAGAGYNWPNSNMASIIPNFATLWYQRTGHRIFFVQYAWCGSPLIGTDGTDYNWGPTGRLRSEAVSAIQWAMSSFIGSGFNATFRGIVWMQGEAEVGTIASGVVTQAQYKQALLDLAGYFAANLWNIPILVVRTGTDIAGSDADYAVVREVQNEVCAESPWARMIYTGTLVFPAMGWMDPAPQSVHYNQLGLNYVGEQVANNYYGPKNQPF